MTTSAAGRLAILALVVAALVMFVGGGSRFAIGLTLKPIVEEFASGRGLVGLAAALFQVVSAICLFYSGRLADRMNVTGVLAGGLAIAALGLAGMGLATEPWHIVVLYGVVFAIGNGIASLIPIGVMISRHFPDRIGLANAVALMGMGAGQLLMIATLTQVLDTIGWRQVFLWICIANLAVLPLVLAVRSGNAGSAARVGPSPAAPAADLSLTEALRTPRFRLILGVYLICGFEDFFVATHLVAFAQDRGADTLLSGHLLAAMGLASIVGVLIAGWSSDRIGPAAATLGSFLIRGALFAAVLIDQSTTTVAVFALLFGATFLVTAPLTVVFAREAFGTRHLGAITGFVTMVHHIAGGLGALIGAALFDAHGTYTVMLWMMLASSLLAAALSCRLGVLRKP